MKAAVEQYTTSAARLYAGAGIRVNCVVVGSTDFPGGIWERIRQSDFARWERQKKSIPLGGFATPDDVEALELVQQGLANWQDDRWTEMSRGIGREDDQLNSDEHHLRIFWRKWNQMMEGV